MISHEILKCVLPNIFKLNFLSEYYKSTDSVGIVDNLKCLLLVDFSHFPWFKNVGLGEI